MDTPTATPAPTTTTATTTTTAAQKAVTNDLDRATRVEQAVSRAIDLVRRFSERDPYDGDVENPWKNPHDMLEELDRARNDVVDAAGWRDDNNNSIDDDDNKKSSATKRKDHTTTTTMVVGDENHNNRDTNDDDIRAAYMDMVTNAFADVLEDMRNSVTGEEELDVDILVDCLQSGLDFMSGEEKDFFLMDNNDNDDDLLLDDEAAITTTPHEERRLQLGLHVH